MTEGEIIDVLREGLWAAFAASLPILGVALVVGLAIGLLQALTSVQEMTLTFVPKLAAMAVAYWISMGFMGAIFVNFWRDTLVPMIAGGAVALALLAPLPAAAAPDPAALCEAAGARAARAEGVPPELMRAISLAETGTRRAGRFAPWPWTVNMEGEGRWFDSPGELLAWVRGRQAAGARSFDLGCFQVNHLWHGEHFDSLEAMLDPDANARYAARFLRALHAEAGDWETAAGRYHSRTPELARRYRVRVAEIAARLDGLDLAAAPAPGGAPPAPLASGPRPPVSAFDAPAGGVSLALLLGPRRGGAPHRAAPLLTRSAGGLLARSAAPLLVEARPAEPPR